jgi:hypothetical protein
MLVVLLDGARIVLPTEAADGEQVQEAQVQVEGGVLRVEVQAGAEAQLQGGEAQPTLEAAVAVGGARLTVLLAGVVAAGTCKSETVSQQYALCIYSWSCIRHL